MPLRNDRSQVPEINFETQFCRGALRCNFLDMRADCITSSLMQAAASDFAWRDLTLADLKLIKVTYRQFDAINLKLCNSACQSMWLQFVKTGSNEDPWCRQLWPRWACVLPPKEPACSQMLSNLADYLRLTPVDAHCCYFGRAKANRCLSLVIAQRSVLYFFSAACPHTFFRIDSANIIARILSSPVVSWGTSHSRRIK